MPRHPHKSPDKLLDEALERSHFWRLLGEDKKRRGRMPKIALKPDMDFFDPGAPTGAAPQLVEALVQRLFDRAYTDLTICDGCNLDDTWLHNRDPLCVPDLVGYRFSVPSGPYTVVGLSERLVRGVFPAGHPLHEYGVCAAWLDADFRIIFAKNKTDEELCFALGAYNLLGLLPEARVQTRTGAEPPAAVHCVELLRQFPVHFCLIDGVVSSHGPAGSRLPYPLDTNTVIASPSVLLADWVAAVKMGLDPYASPINAHALRCLQLPRNFVIDGDLTPYPLWQNPHPLVTKSVRARNRSALAARFGRPLLQPVNREVFPFRELAVDRLNAYLTAPRPGETGPNAQTSWLAAPLNFLVGMIAGAVYSFRRGLGQTDAPHASCLRGPWQWSPRRWRRLAEKFRKKSLAVSHANSPRIRPRCARSTPP